MDNDVIKAPLFGRATTTHPHTTHTATTNQTNHSFVVGSPDYVCLYVLEDVYYFTACSKETPLVSLLLLTLLLVPEYYWNGLHYGIIDLMTLYCRSKFLAAPNSNSIG